MLSTQPCNCSDCSAQFIDHNNFHGIYHIGCKYCCQLIQKFPNLNFNLFRNIEKLKHPGGFVLDEIPLQPTYEPKTEGKKWNSEFIFSGSWKRAIDKWENGDDDNIWCLHCNKLFWSFEKLRDHAKLRHIGKADKVFGHYYKVVNRRNATRDAPKEFKCDQCSASYPSNKYLKRHEETVHYQESYECSICGKVFTRLDNLTRHQKFDCIEDKDNLGVHRESKFKCEQCGKQFSRLDNLRRHNLVHQDESSKFECKLCRTSFTAKTNLQHHERGIFSSEGLAKNKCDVCDEEFCTSKILRKHVNARHRHSCEQCGQNFTLKSSLDRHIASRHDVSCEECGKGCCNTNALKRHMKEVHYIECDQCGQHVREKYLKIHNQNVHKGS